MKKKYLLGLIVIATLSSCVPARKYEDLKAKSQQCEEELLALKAKSESCLTENTELAEKLKKSQREVIEAQGDLSDIKRRFADKEDQYGKLEGLYDKVLSRYDRILASTSNENSQLSSSLEQTKADLQKKEDQLNLLERDLDALRKKLEEKEKALELREKRIRELEELIAQKDAAVNALKEKVSNALMAFKDKGLTVEQKNGKVYVSLEAKLLFPSGSTKVDSKGKVALVELAKVLENEKDLEVVVEGHTDTDKLSSSVHPKNNWELSVLRATAVVEIMTANSAINPKVLSAAGRSEYLPVGEDKAKNRRIEVILTPNLDKLFEIISQ
jgi:chemotaxis protein MotB